MLKDKVCLVTGSARGIGLAVARRFAENGARIVLSDVLEGPLKESVTQFEAEGFSVRGFVSDVTKVDQVERLISSATGAFGSLDVVVNNAGITRDTLLIRMSEDDWDKVIAVNLKGAFLVSQAAAKVMMKQRSGRIINISSVVGLMGNFGQVNYSASKAGLLGLTKSVARELAPRGICVNAIAPGFIETEMTAALSDKAKAAFLENIPLNRAGTADDIADTAIFLAGPLSSYITGQVIGVNGGLYM